LSETELATMQVGSSVTVRSWETYENLTGTIVEISEFPVEQGYYWHYSSGNQNVSLYPFTVFLPEDVSLRENEYVEMSYDPGAATGGSGLCLQNAFIRTENGKSYIWVRGEDGLLEKRQVQTGRSLWGSYLEILSGFSMEDYVAFPYGRSLREGARTQEATIDELYNYY
ncbi:MAG: HlyD family secretion protein, partial [Oscillospiraceae bacterium]|nr:HlyD family secretion protein [Oscillospiraceae bacterium]